MNFLSPGKIIFKLKSAKTISEIVWLANFLIFLVFLHNEALEFSFSVILNVIADFKKIFFLTIYKTIQTIELKNSHK